MGIIPERCHTNKKTLPLNKDYFYDPRKRTKITAGQKRAGLVDSYRHKGMRKRLVQKIAKKGIQDKRILEAIGTLPRHFFLDKAFEEWAYQDKPFPIGNEQTISQPYTVAYQTALLQVEKGDKILEIGTGSGYQASILSMLGAHVYTIERQEALSLSAKKLIKELRIPRIHFYFKDGFEGLPHLAPFDKILVTAGATQKPDILLQQLAIGGHIVIPIGQDIQVMHRITRIAEHEFKEELFDNFKFVPFLGGIVKR